MVWLIESKIIEIESITPEINRYESKSKWWNYGLFYILNGQRLCVPLHYFCKNGLFPYDVVFVVTKNVFEHSLFSISKGFIHALDVIVVYGVSLSHIQYVTVQVYVYVIFWWPSEQAKHPLDIVTGTSKIRYK